MWKTDTASMLGLGGGGRVGGGDFIIHFFVHSLELGIIIYIHVDVHP